MEIKDSTPAYGDFNPLDVAYQAEVIDDVKFNYDYGLGVHQVLLSGSAGSAKSILMAHLACRHCLEFPKARCLIGRKSLPDLKDTIYLKIKDHLRNDDNLIEGKHWKAIDNIAKIEFANGSEIISRSWADTNYMKFRSLELSMAIIEELTENNKKASKAYFEILKRVGRLPHIPENLVISATNPDSPSHWAYNHFELELDEKSEVTRNDLRLPTKHVYYSKTSDNKFLPASYLQNMLENTSEAEFQRMGLGRWLDLVSEVIYSSYSKERNFVREDYELNPWEPIHLSWDFNIGKGKPLSMVLFQFINGVFHFYDEIIIHGADTEESCIELGARGLLNHDTLYYIHGDATGESKSTKSKKTDYDIIKKYLSNYRTPAGFKIDFKMAVPKSNPPVRTRHNMVNAYMRNALGQVKLKVYKKCKTLDEGFRMTQLKEGGKYIEDDSAEYQHCTTSAGYGICWVYDKLVKNRPESSSKRIR